MHWSKDHTILQMNCTTHPYKHQLLKWPAYVGSNSKQLKQQMWSFHTISHISYFELLELQIWSVILQASRSFQLQLEKNTKSSCPEITLHVNMWQYTLISYIFCLFVCTNCKKTMFFTTFSWSIIIFLVIISKDF